MRYYLEAALVSFTAFLLNILPVNVSTQTAKFFGRLSYHLMPQRKKTARENLRRAYGDSKTTRELEKIAIASFENVALSMVELFLVKKTEEIAEERFEFTHYEQIEEAHRRGKGIILVISHLGSWEYLSFLPFLKDCPSSVVVKNVKNPHVNEKIDALRRVMTVHPISKTNATRQIFQELKKNRLVAVLIDQWAGPEGIWCDFFGHPTSTTSIPARLAQKTGATLVPGFCIRKGGGKYEIRFEKILEGDSKSAIWERETTGKLNKLLEEAILKYPEQWTWGHRRWKPKPKIIRAV